MIIITILTAKTAIIKMNIVDDWLEISLVFDKNDKHTTIYDSYNLERASNFIKKVSTENASNTYNAAKKLKYDISDTTEKHMFYKQFVVWNCNGCSITPLTE